MNCPCRFVLKTILHKRQKKEKRERSYESGKTRHTTNNMNDVNRTRSLDTNLFLKKKNNRIWALKMHHLPH